MEGIHSSLDDTEERISKLGYQIVDIAQTE